MSDPVHKLYRCKTFGKRHFVLQFSAATELWYSVSHTGTKIRSVVAINIFDTQDGERYYGFNFFGISIMAGLVQP